MPPIKLGPLKPPLAGFGLVVGGTGSIVDDGARVEVIGFGLGLSVVGFRVVLVEGFSEDVVVFEVVIGCEVVDVLGGGVVTFGVVVSGTSGVVISLICVMGGPGSVELFTIIGGTSPLAKEIAQNIKIVTK